MPSGRKRPTARWNRWPVHRFTFVAEGMQEGCHRAGATQAAARIRRTIVRRYGVAESRQAFSGALFCVSSCARHCGDPQQQALAAWLDGRGGIRRARTEGCPGRALNGQLASPGHLRPRTPLRMPAGAKVTPYLATPDWLAHGLDAGRREAHLSVPQALKVATSTSRCAGRSGSSAVTAVTPW